MRNDPMELHRVYRRVFGCADGETVMTDLARRGFLNRSAYSAEPGRIQFNEGRRSMVLHIHHMMDEQNFIQKDGIDE